MELSMIFAVAHNLVIGKDGDLPWRLPNDLSFFKSMTMGKPIVMGRRTFESIGRPLPGRPNWVLTRSSSFQAPGCRVLHDTEEVLELGRDHAEVVVIGGGTLYAAFLPLATRIYMTVVHADVEGDTYLPAIDFGHWQVREEEAHPSDDRNQWAHTFFHLDRIQPFEGPSSAVSDHLPARFLSP